MKCTKPNCDCLEKEMERIGGEVKYGYPCLSDKADFGQLKSTQSPAQKEEPKEWIMTMFPEEDPAHNAQMLFEIGVNWKKKYQESQVEIATIKAEIKIHEDCETRLATENDKLKAAETFSREFIVNFIEWIFKDDFESGMIERTDTSLSDLLNDYIKQKQ